MKGNSTYQAIERFITDLGLDTNLVLEFSCRADDYLTVIAFEDESRSRKIIHEFDYRKDEGDTK